MPAKRSGFFCPWCGSTDNIRTNEPAEHYRDSKTGETLWIKRTYTCEHCGGRFSTGEILLVDDGQ